MIDIIGVSSEFKKKWLPSQMPSVRERNHSWRGGTTIRYGDYNGKITLTPLINRCQEKNATLWQKILERSNQARDIIYISKKAGKTTEIGTLF